MLSLTLGSATQFNGHDAYEIQGCSLHHTNRPNPVRTPSVLAHGWSEGAADIRSASYPGGRIGKRSHRRLPRQASEL